MMNRSTTALFFVFTYLQGSNAFQMHRRSVAPTKIFAEANPFREVDVDIDLAEDCATHFGKYSFDQIEHCRDDLHARRVQNVAFGDDTSPDVIKERFLEVELTMQLEKLRDEMPESYLFADEETYDSDIDTDIDMDGLLMDNGLIAMDLPPREGAESFDKKILENKKMMLWKELAEEGVLESVAICGLLGFMMMAPKLF